MQLSHEIIVLDYGDEQTNPFDFDKVPANRGNGKLTFCLLSFGKNTFNNCFPLFPASDYQASPVTWDHATVNEAPFSRPVDHLLETVNTASCPTRSSVLGLAVTCALMVVLYVCTIFFYCLRRAAARGAGGGKAGREYMR